MGFNERALDDYVDVSERISEFYSRYPDGSLQPYDPSLAPYQIVQVLEQTFIVYVAAAYRTPDDPRPGIGVAWEVFPGRTSFTRGSEVMNAETSAWGRAIAALGIATKKGIASRQEISGRRDDDTQEAAPAPARTRPPRRPTAAVTRTKVTGADHERLRHGTVERTPDDHPAERGPLPDNENPWQDVPDYERPGTADAEDVKAIQIAYKTLGISNRQQALTVSRQLVGRSLTGPNAGLTHNNLSATEAKALKKTLEGFGGDRGALMERLTGITQAVAAVDAHDAAEGTQEAPMPGD